MKSLRLIALLVGALLIHSGPVRADQFGDDFPRFASLVKAALPLRPQVVVLYEQGQNNRLNDEKLAAFSHIAKEQALIWADTILEGDFEADNNTRLDRVEALMIGEQLIAYRISYSERGWFVGRCSYDWQDKSLLNECHEGRIVESSFVSPDFSSWMRDDQAYAQFVE